MVIFTIYNINIIIEYHLLVLEVKILLIFRRTGDEFYYLCCIKNNFLSIANSRDIVTAGNNTLFFFFIGLDYFYLLRDLLFRVRLSIFFLGISCDCFSYLFGDWTLPLGSISKDPYLLTFLCLIFYLFANYDYVFRRYNGIVSG